ncbi:hypothetical protein C7B80_03965 [Cyanosarcina cf. burmensis CCALA 770]|nr:hypothetical protein C7B80_03965 [Cyanosarcina cf. burmensis CCALA 770]
MSIVELLLVWKMPQFDPRSGNDLQEILVMMLFWHLDELGIWNLKKLGNFLSSKILIGKFLPRNWNESEVRAIASTRFLREL